MYNINIRNCRIVLYYFIFIFSFSDNDDFSKVEDYNIEMDVFGDCGTLSTCITANEDSSQFFPPGIRLRDARSYKCCVCDLSFSAFKCAFCHMEFASTSNLNIHTEIHIYELNLNGDASEDSKKEFNCHFSRSLKTILNPPKNINVTSVSCYF